MSDTSAEKKRGLPSRVRMRHGQHFVEELAARSEAPVGRMMSISQIDADPRQPRSAMGELDDLVDSIRRKGVLEPILVRRSPEDPTRFLIIAGERRYRASLEAGLIEMPIIELDVSEGEALEIALIENLQRKDLTPFEEAEGFQALGQLHGYTHEQIAATVGKSRVVITEALSLLQMPARVRDAVQALGISSKSLLLEVLKAKTEDEMIQLVEQIATRNLSRDDLRRQKQRAVAATAVGGRRKPFVFSFAAPDKSFRLSLKFRRSQVETTELIDALEGILADLRSTGSGPADDAQATASDLESGAPHAAVPVAAVSRGTIFFDD